ncbi:MAG: hypothetical protein HY903_02270 [Deltaproteobacteria bacterium]|nr:hypothetical protein [Deltaproteobacteria bacterium]
MAERLFVPQQKLEAWLEAREVTFDDNILVLLKEKLAYTLEPAVRVVSLIDGTDHQEILGKTLTVAEVTALKGEHYRASVILGDTAYQCEEGFVGTASITKEAPAATPTPAAKAAPAARAAPTTKAPPPPAPTAAAPHARPAASTPTAPEAVGADDGADMLAAFMLKHM